MSELLGAIYSAGDRMKKRVRNMLTRPEDFAAMLNADAADMQGKLASGDPEQMLELFGPGAMVGQVAGKATKKVSNALSKNKKNIARADIPKLVPSSEDDMIRSLQSDVRLKGGGTIPRAEVEQALANRMRYQAEPQTLPKKPEEMSDQDWVDFGKQYGADFSQNPMQSLGVSDIRTRREAMLPGGLEGKFTIPDLFRIKAQNFDPSILPQETHNALMKKFIRTYDRGPNGGDDVDLFNDLNFSLLSPKAPLTSNEFLAQRFRLSKPEELEALAAREGTPDLAKQIDTEFGVGAASRGGLGVKGTADLSNQATLARLLGQKPEMFRPYEGETLRDVGFRLVNQVPGLSIKTSSLGVPMNNLAKGNTSAVDLWMIRKNYEKLAQENPQFAQRMSDLQATNPNLSAEEAAINIISKHPDAVYRMKGGELHPNLPSYLSPEKLAFEPGKFQVPSEYYTDIMSMVDRSRGAKPEIELFPEQWRLWDTYRGRVEPHEMLHPDWRKIPKQSFSEMRNALQAHKEAGYMSAPEAKVQPMNTENDWRKLYYGFISPKQAAVLAGVAGAGAYATNSLMRPKEKVETATKDRNKRMRDVDAAVYGSEPTK